MWRTRYIPAIFSQETEKTEKGSAEAEPFCFTFFISCCDNRRIRIHCREGKTLPQGSGYG